MNWRVEVSRTLFNKYLLGFFLLLLIPLALAVTTVQTDASSYKSGETVTISGVCSSPSVPVGLRALLDGETVWFDQATSDASKSYVSQFVPPQKGKYIITAACQGDNAVTTEITVADASTTPTDTGGDSPTTPSSGGNGGGGGGGGGSGCTPEWVYSAWSKCGADLQQTRTAEQVKTKCANVKPKQADLVRACAQCEESWTCGEWSACVGSFQSRDCFDDTQCGTFALQPETTRSCYVAPQVQQQTPSKPFFPQVTQAVSTFWDDYMYWIIGVPIGILLLILLIILLRLLFRKKVVYDDAEVKAWARKERQAGTPIEDVKDIVHQYTHWDRAKIDLLLSGLK